MLDSATAKGVTITSLMLPADHAATVSTAAGVDVTDYEGFMIFEQTVGVVTGGKIEGKIITSDASNLGSPTTVHEFAEASTTTDEVLSSVVVDCRKLKKYVGYVGTVTTGPAIASCVMIGKKKYVAG